MEAKHIIPSPTTNDAAKDKLLNNMYVTNVEKRLRELNSPSENDKKRWIWELIQNAKDTIAKDPNRSEINVRIEIDGDTVRFKHDGNPFTADSRLALLYKYSEDKENQESTGRFGTGFLTTHCLSKIVTIESNMYSDAEQTRLCGFKVTLFRDGLIKSELIEGLEKMRKSEEFYDETFEWTTFTYHVNSESGKSAIRLGVQNFHENIAQTMLFCKELRSCELDDNGEITRIIREPEVSLTDNINMATFVLKGTSSSKRRFIYTSHMSHNDKLSARYKSDRSIRLDAAIEINDDMELVEHMGKTSFFCVLPLVGIENQVNEPIIINSPDFEPDTERQSLLLSGQDWNEEKNVITEVGINKLIYTEVFPLYKRLVSFLSSKKYKKLYFLANGLKNAKKHDKLDADWYSAEIIQKYRGILLSLPVVNSWDGTTAKKLSDSIIVKEKTQEYEVTVYGLIKPLYPSNLISENHEWASRLWKEDLNLWNTEDLCSDIESKGNWSNIKLEGETLSVWYNNFLKHVSEYNELLLKDYALLPNMNGDLLKKDSEDFKQGVNTTSYVIGLLSKLGEDVKPRLLHGDISSVSLEAKYNSQSYSADINKLAKAIIDDTSVTDKVNRLLPLLSTIPDDNTRLQENFIARRKSFYQICISLFEITGNTPTVDNNLLEGAWKDLDIWFISHVLETLSNKAKLTELPSGLDTQWLNGALKSLNVQPSQLNTYAVLPNQKGNFCFQKDLFEDGDIPPVLKSDLFNNINLSYKDILLDKQIEASAFSINQKKTVATFASELNGKFISYSDPNKPNYFRGRSHHYEKNVLDTIARYMTSILPENLDSDLGKRQNGFYKVGTSILGKGDENIKNGEEDGLMFTNSYISYENADLWQSADLYLAHQIIEVLESIGSLEKLSIILNKCGEKLTIKLLNEFYALLLDSKIPYDSASIFPNQKGAFRSYSDLKAEEGEIDELLKDVIYYIIVQDEDYRSILIDKRCCLQPTVKICTKDAYRLIDDTIFEQYGKREKWDETWFKDATHILLEVWPEQSQAFNSNNFPKLYPIKDTIITTVIWSKQLRSLMNDVKTKYTPEQIETLRNDSEQIGKLIQIDRKQLSAFHDILQEFPEVDFNSILHLLKEQQGTFDIHSAQQDISDFRKTEIGDKGECYIYEQLCKKFDPSEITWSNFAPNDPDARIVAFGGKEYHLRTTSHNFDFIVSSNGKTFYIEVKTTVGSVRNCNKNFPLIFEPKEWEWIDNNRDNEALHFIVRVFDIEGTPKAYYLKQSLSID